MKLSNEVGQLLRDEGFISVLYQHLVFFRLGVTADPDGEAIPFPARVFRVAYNQQKFVSGFECDFLLAENIILRARVEIRISRLRGLDGFKLDHKFTSLP